MNTIIEEATKHTYDITSDIDVKSEYDAGYLNALEINGEEIFIAGVEFAQRFIPVEEELPKIDEHVIVKCLSDNGREYLTTAFYVAPKTKKSEEFLPNEDDNTELGLEEYDAEIDDYWVKEGWFEYMTASDVSYYLGDKVISWRVIELKRI